MFPTVALLNHEQKETPPLLTGRICREIDSDTFNAALQTSRIERELSSNQMTGINSYRERLIYLCS